MLNFEVVLGAEGEILSCQAWVSVVVWAGEKVDIADKSGDRCCSVPMPARNCDSQSEVLVENKLSVNRPVPDVWSSIVQRDSISKSCLIVSGDWIAIAPAVEPWR